MLVDYQDRIGKGKNSSQILIASIIDSLNDCCTKNHASFSQSIFYACFKYSLAKLYHNLSFSL